MIPTTHPPARHDVEYLVIGEAAELLRTPIQTMYGWRHRGEGPPARRVGRKLLYRRDELLAWVEAQAAG